DITKENLSSHQLKIKQTLNCASFIALDTEFTGLGNKESNTKASNIEERYINLSKVVKSHALVAFGVTVFEEIVEKEETTSPLEKQYNVYNFNFTLLSQVDHIISPQSLAFLSDTGFDFNKQIRKGIPYFPGKDQQHDANDSNAILRSIFSHIISHNLNTFVADLNEMFSGGIFDTKYIADYITREKSSFLSYLFRKYEREQVERKASGNKDYLLLRIHDCIVLPSTTVEILKSEQFELAKISNFQNKPSKRSQGNSYCEQYALHGFCSQRMRCGKSHDLDFILDEQAREFENKRKQHVSVSMPPTLLPSTKPDQFDTYHSAHFDAYMTGFIFARQLLKYSGTKVLNEYRNKLYLMGRNLPLLVAKSQFSKTIGKVGKVGQFGNALRDVLPFLIE
ncbi:9076_t:CDS:10, partial [Entrophospora sp. SA101]